MSEYIEKEAVINFIEKGLNNPDKTKSFGHDAIEIMAEVRYMPAADVVEVVRCGQCKHAYINSFSAKEGIALCRFLTNHAIDGTSFVRKQDDYCSYGERWDGDTK